MDAVSLNSPLVINRKAARKRRELTDTAVLLHHYKLNEVGPACRETGQGTPQGDPFSMRPRLVPVPRWLAPRPMSSFGVPARQPCFYIRDPRKSMNFRALCWMHTESRLLTKSPLNDTTRRALMPARLDVPLEDSMFRRSRPSNALRAFGSILPGSTLKSYELSTPLPRNSGGHVLTESTKPKPAPIVIPTPPPRVVANNCPNGARIMVHRMNLAREQRWNTAGDRTKVLQQYTTIASGMLSTTTEPTEPASPALRRLTHYIDGLCAYAKKVVVIKSRDMRHQESKILAELRDSLHKRLQSDQAFMLERDRLPLQRSNSSRENPVDTEMEINIDGQPSYSPRTPKPNVELTPPSTPSRTDDSQPSTSMDTSTPTGSSSGQQDVSHGSAHISPTTNTTREAPKDLASTTWPIPELSPGERQPPVAPNPKPRQKRQRAPAPYSVPSTRVLRSMKVKSDNVPAPATIPSGASASRVVVPSVVRHQPRKELRARQVPRACTNTSTPAPVASASTTHRYNLRPRKRELDKGQGSKQASRPAKRRRV
ncbi:unnamed protein product [Rhizoctonia solani]|uniref:Uncharacterized protein n=1 Tax=Rhizoctonia solani TaxID=456999 RepID=A0A8H3E131_9AGAM|nr:unnamed protein product [Rhizoctonia solani]